ncbi:sensor domain-containing diguanylate cyclase [[Clostridium] polysaccharolyticum]|uniref:Diguanylate cyclase (GGDEF) domain-containing protein n=1 Tax=[Clostridium] polysaccharolyticum TaxID=29364 RepID=A0A1I0AY12_9FIRM|nr:sensor domain-containing diguanylate cyclase [[Clostridium] polysaccharolyticum]SES99409.1 diguanylate cyclase (GGDEF) domain-containing protein [[Clostridium] polysaccharolyticum]
MDYDQILLLQRKFIDFHKVLTVILVCFNLHFALTVTGYNCFYPALAMLAILIMENVVIKMTPVRLKVLMGLKYLYVFFMVMFIVAASSVYAFGIGLLCLMLYNIEFYFTLDFSESFVRKIYVVLVSIPVLVGIIIVLIKSHSGDWMKHFEMFCIVILYIGLVWFFSEMIAQVIGENDRKLFAQTRLIERINETNEELRIQQQKVKSTNELLGVQKIELQATYEKINNVNEEMQIQNDILKYISSSLEISKLMALITESFVSRIGADFCAIVLKPGTANNKKLTYKIQDNLGNDFKEHLSECIQKNCFEEIMEQEEIIVDNDVDFRKYEFLACDSVGSILLIPLVKQEQQIGLLFVGTKRKNYFVDNIDFFEGIVAQFLIALNNANLYAEMQSMAILDGLTGIYNRRHLTKLFNEYMYESINNRTPMSVALFDIDFFKRINDTYGHLFGDLVIRTIASLAKNIADENDGIVSRYGGEEFVIIFPNKGLDEAYPAVERLHKDVKELGIEHHGKQVKVNVSIGFTSFPKTCKDPRELLNRADWSMYYSKQHGRDQITIDSDEIRKEVSLE